MFPKISPDHFFHKPRGQCFQPLGQHDKRSSGGTNPDTLPGSRKGCSRQSRTRYLSSALEQITDLTVIIIIISLNNSHRIWRRTSQFLWPSFVCLFCQSQCTLGHSRVAPARHTLCCHLQWILRAHLKLRTKLKYLQFLPGWPDSTLKIAESHENESYYTRVRYYV